MKKFKLIKEYPGSTVLGTIAQPNDLIQHDFFEKYSEYWEEVIEKDYEILISRVVPQEILSVKRLSDGEVFTVGDRAMTQGSRGGHSIRQFRVKQKCNIRTAVPGIFIKDGIDRIWIDWEEGCGGNWLESTEKIIENDYEIISYVAKDCDIIIVQGPKTVGIIGNKPRDYWKIHTVKRLSDGEVFTVGDVINIIGNRCVRITEFENPEANEYFINISNGAFASLSTIKKSKQPIFLTHDGKDIFEGDTVWYVNKENFYHNYIKAYPEVRFNSEIRAYFLTEEAALDYIDKNKVLFITSNGVGIKKGDMSHGACKTTNTISNTVVGCNRGLHDTFESIFSTRAAAENYVERNRPRLSIEDCFKILQNSFYYGNGFEKEIEKYIRKNNK